MPKVILPSVTDTAERARLRLPPIPDETEPLRREVLGLPPLDVEPETPEQSNPDRPASRLAGWDADIDHTKRHALVDANGFIKWLIHPHVKGSITGPSAVSVLEGERIVEIVGDLNDEQRSLYKKKAAMVAEGVIVPAAGPVIDNYRKAIAAEIDQATGVDIRRGFAYQGTVVSLSPNAIAKYTAAKAIRSMLIFPHTFSGLNNVDEITFHDADELDEFVNTALLVYISKLDAGDSHKREIRNADSPSHVDIARRRDSRPIE